MKIDKRLSNIFLKFKKQKVFLIIIIILTTLISAFIPFLVMDLIDTITYHLNFSKITKLGTLIIAITLIKIVLDFTQNYYWHKLRLNAVNHLREFMFEKMLYKSKEYFDKTSTGKILTMIMDDSSIVAQNIVIGMPMLASNIIHLLTVSVVLFILSKQLFLVLLILIPIYTIVFNKLNSKIRNISKIERVHFADIMNDAQEKIDGIDTIKVFQREEFMYKNFSEKIQNHFKFVSKNLFYESMGRGITDGIIALTPIVILLYGSFLIANEKLTLGGLMAFYTYISYLYEPLMNLSDFNLGRQKAISVGENILNFIDIECNEKDGVFKISEFEKLEFKNVCFSYKGENDIIKELSFTINKGDKVAIKGGSGSGKSTLLKLILRMYNPTYGNIYINNIDIRDIELSSLYKLFSIQVQNLFVFEGTIEENISLGKTINIEKIYKSMDLGQLNRTLNPFNNINNNINNNLLSGGQKQRLCLSRAFLKPFDILILDEPSSSIDIDLEDNLKLDLKKLIGEKTLIITSHRPSLLELCNKEINLETENKAKNNYVTAH
ncbi:MAG: ABC transporter ATP-binding protein [Paraclostridium sordellii]|uniref:ABC transporter ATP-binding protein n=1 Tax=Paraclostridium sordellii TaxID=1505 RepID=UPI0005426DFF|nr:ABC transporter ATP-binding protein [Paeniclostridium sordellii]CEK35024.1 multidrug ABC transporter ATPase and permease,Lipid A export ATP-binding/permease protein MsbA,lipid transporter ATP-binding/permease protein,ABC-type bacteriocin/lantibiotic exporters, contain an N-terminal double-glycine peptidase domain,lipid A export permease/ATP-binding protein MsbA,ABC transporter transmembrane region [[Clostridium] sordellii] [Paeniclostridium sordellii]